MSLLYDIIVSTAVFRFVFQIGDYSLISWVLSTSFNLAYIQAGDDIESDHAFETSSDIYFLDIRNSHFFALKIFKIHKQISCFLFFDVGFRRLKNRKAKSNLF